VLVGLFGGVAFSSSKTDTTDTGMVGHGRPTTTTAAPGPKGGGRAFKDAPTPGYWYKVQPRDLRPVAVHASRGSSIAVLIPDPTHALAWRAYVGVSDQRPNRDASLSKWVGLDGILGPRAGFDSAVSLLPEIMGGVSGGLAGDWKSVGQSAANIVTSVWSGVKAKQDAAESVVSQFGRAFAGNLVSAPQNDQRTTDPLYGLVLSMSEGDRLYIPEPAEYFTPGTNRG